MLAFKLRILFFFCLGAFLLDSYVWQAFKTITKNKSERFKKRLFYIYWAIPTVIILFFVLFLFNDSLNQYKYIRTYFQGFIMVLYSAKLLVFIFLLADDLKRGLLWIKHHVYRLLLGNNKKQISHDKIEEAEEIIEENIQPKELQMNRSEFLAKAGLISSAVPFVLLTRGMYRGAYNYQVRSLDIILPNLPASFDGLKVLQISDIHCGSFLDRTAVARGIQLIKEQNADLVLFTGDLVNNKAEEAQEWKTLFAEITAPMGVFSILGNHDYGDYVNNWKSPEEKEANFNELLSIHKEMGWNLLRNEHVLLEREGKQIALIGVENWGDKARFQKKGDLKKAIQGMPEVPVKLLMSHDPSHFERIVSVEHQDIDLTFSGHTHGFQFGVEFGPIRWSPSQYMYKQWADLYEKGNQKIYVNRGFGFLGYPGRVGIMPEITVLNLYRS